MTTRTQRVWRGVNALLVALAFGLPPSLGAWAGQAGFATLLDALVHPRQWGSAVFLGLGMLYGVLTLAVAMGRVSARFRWRAVPLATLVVYAVGVVWGIVSYLTGPRRLMDQTLLGMAPGIILIVLAAASSCLQEVAEWLTRRKVLPGQERPFSP